MIDNNIRDMNKEYIFTNEKCQTIINNIKDTVNFIDKYGYLIFGRDYIQCKQHIFSLQIIFNSAQSTLLNMINCCEYFCIADAYTLLRKYRDDLFFILYILVYDSNIKLGINNKTNIMENNIEKWCKNGLNDLKISEVLKTIGTSSSISEAAKKYNLHSEFDKIGKQLNDYVHSNGYSFYNKNIRYYKENEILRHLQEVSYQTNYITVTFILLIIMCAPFLVMSTDYMDYLDAGAIPPENSQYLVAPFVEDFLKSNLDMVGKNCYDYLKENTCMIFE